MRFSVTFVAALLYSAKALSQIAPPLVDGSCTEYRLLKSDSVKIDDRVTLYYYQDSYFVWFCYTYPMGSFGTMDLKLTTQNHPAPINLHVSAQLGEWLVGDTEAIPQDAQSDKWWNISGWTANTVWINGMDRSGETPRFKFKNAPARELQLSKERFGKGEWNFSMDIRSIKNSDESFYNISFPASGVPYKLSVY